MSTLHIEILKHREYWSFAEAALVCGKSAAFYRQLFKAGAVHGYNAGGKTNKRVLLSAASVRAYFESQRIDVAPAPVKKLTARQWAQSHGFR